MANGTLKVGEITTSSGSGNITIGSGVILNSNTPAFRARKTSNQSAATGTNVKITFDTEDYDTDNAFTDSKFTVPSGQAGKYLFIFFTRIRNAADITSQEWSFYKNGSKEDRISTQHNYTSGDSQYQSYGFSTTLNLSASDYIEVYVNHNASGAVEINGGTGITIFQGFKIGA
tara:strand:- start:1 stop:519 length:519 start_codon:yes stop_codon:yes gene_type:complete